MIHDHDHHHPCSHPRITLCSTCDVTYCKDCKKEWGQRKYNPNSTFWGLTGNTTWKTNNCH